MANQFEIELRPHVGRMVKGGVEVEVELDQYEILVNGVRVGYTPKKPQRKGGQWVSYIRYDWPQAMKDAVERHVRQELGAVGNVGEPPAPTEEEPELDEFQRRQQQEANS